jgi:lauroyl/myristoyl acyltransferase
VTTITSPVSPARRGPGRAEPAALVRGRARPILAARAIVYALDLLPFPLGEHLCAAVFLALAVVRPGRLRRAFAWAAHHPRPGRSRLWIAAALCAFEGRARARHALVGLRTPGDLLREVRVSGTEHLPAGGAILLGLHVGLPAVGEALIASGHDLVAIGGARHSRSWRRAAWAPVRANTDGFPLSGDIASLGGVLFRARRRLLEGRAVYLAADGLGRRAFTLDIEGTSPLPLSAGWLALRRDCGVPVLPVLSHREGRRQVIDIHLPLPAALSDPARDAEACQERLRGLLHEYANRFPEQCSGLVFR